MNRFFPFLLALCLGGAAQAQTPPSSADTIVSLHATGHVSVQPDLLYATLHATGTGPTAAEAQERLNRTVQTAERIAKAVAGVNFAAGSYQVNQGTPPDPRWSASQSIQLKALDGTTVLLTLVGQLQQAGLATDEIGWSLAPAKQAKAQEAALTAALADLRRQADVAAAALGLSFHRFNHIEVESDNASGTSMRMQPMVMRAAAPPDVTQPSDATVDVSVAGEAVLAPR